MIPFGVNDCPHNSFNLDKADWKKASDGLPTISAFTSAEYSSPLTKHPRNWSKNSKFDHRKVDDF